MRNRDVKFYIVKKLKLVLDMVGFDKTELDYFLNVDVMLAKDVNRMFKEMGHHLTIEELLHNVDLDLVFAIDKECDTDLSTVVMPAELVSQMKRNIIDAERRYQENQISRRRGSFESAFSFHGHANNNSHTVRKTEVVEEVDQLDVLKSRRDVEMQKENNVALKRREKEVQQMLKDKAQQESKALKEKKRLEEEQKRISSLFTKAEVKHSDEKLKLTEFQDNSEGIIPFLNISERQKLKEERMAARAELTAKKEEEKRLLKAKKEAEVAEAIKAKQLVKQQLMEDKKVQAEIKTQEQNIQEQKRIQEAQRIFEEKRIIAQQKEEEQRLIREQREATKNEAQRQKLEAKQQVDQLAVDKKAEKEKALLEAKRIKEEQKAIELQREAERKLQLEELRKAQLAEQEEQKRLLKEQKEAERLEAIRQKEQLDRELAEKKELAKQDQLKEAKMALELKNKERLAAHAQRVADIVNSKKAKLVEHYLRQQLKKDALESKEMKRKEQVHKMKLSKVHFIEKVAYFDVSPEKKVEIITDKEREELDRILYHESELRKREVEKTIIEDVKEAEDESIDIIRDISEADVIVEHDEIIQPNDDHVLEVFETSEIPTIVENVSLVIDVNEAQEQINQTTNNLEKIKFKANLIEQRVYKRLEQETIKQSKTEEKEHISNVKNRALKIHVARKELIKAQMMKDIEANDKYRSIALHMKQEEVLKKRILEAKIKEENRSRVKEKISRNRNIKLKEREVAKEVKRVETERIEKIKFDARNKLAQERFIVRNLKIIQAAHIKALKDNHIFDARIEKEKQLKIQEEERIKALEMKRILEEQRAKELEEKRIRDAEENARVLAAKKLVEEQRAKELEEKRRIQEQERIKNIEVKKQQEAERIKQVAAQKEARLQNEIQRKADIESLRLEQEIKNMSSTSPLAYKYKKDAKTVSSAQRKLEKEVLAQKYITVAENKKAAELQKKQNFKLQREQLVVNKVEMKKQLDNLNAKNSQAESSHELSLRAIRKNAKNKIKIIDMDSSTDVILSNNDFIDKTNTSTPLMTSKEKYTVPKGKQFKEMKKQIMKESNDKEIVRLRIKALREKDFERRNKFVNEAAVLNEKLVERNEKRLRELELLKKREEQYEREKNKASQTVTQAAKHDVLKHKNQENSNLKQYRNEANNNSQSRKAELEKQRNMVEQRLGNVKQRKEAVNVEFDLLKHKVQSIDSQRSEKQVKRTSPVTDKKKVVKTKNDIYANRKNHSDEVQLRKKALMSKVEDYHNDVTKNQVNNIIQHELEILDQLEKYELENLNKSSDVMSKQEYRMELQNIKNKIKMKRIKVQSSENKEELAQKILEKVKE